MAITFVAAAVVVVFRLAPAGYTLALSLTDALLLLPEHSFVGLSNYRRLLGDSSFWHSLGITARYVVATLALASITGLLIAARIRQPTLWSSAMRVGFLLPFVLPTVVTAAVWSWIFDPYRGLNSVLMWVGIEGPGWLVDPSWALRALIAMSAWKEVGFAVVVFLAALARIPWELEAAATVDGASPWQCWRYVVLPLLWPAFGVLVITMGLRLFDSFAPVFMLTGGGPAGATTTWSFLLYVTAFERYQTGYASAMATWIGLGLAVFLWPGRRRFLSQSQRH